MAVTFFNPPVAFGPDVTQEHTPPILWPLLSVYKQLWSAESWDDVIPLLGEGSLGFAILTNLPATFAPTTPPALNVLLLVTIPIGDTNYYLLQLEIPPSSSPSSSTTSSSSSSSSSVTSVLKYIVYAFQTPPGGPAFLDLLLNQSTIAQRLASTEAADVAPQIDTWLAQVIAVARVL